MDLTTTGRPSRPEEVREAIEATGQRLRALLPGLTDAGTREPSELPGWSRAHVLSHIEGIGLAMARQARYALRGELVEPYDGAGRGARPRSSPVRCATLRRWPGRWRPRWTRRRRPGRRSARPTGRVRCATATAICGRH
ncbi:maleylpyruvate isomerase N-terminal domain-containing protein [Streptomyces lydicus]|nr:maleylpyruvate isomerase N-terminal domain-containing protein [Streptomyces lydicus]